MSRSPALPLVRKPADFQCPYCLRPVGILGNLAARVLGTNLHGCDFSNVKDIEPIQAD